MSFKPSDVAVPKNVQRNWNSRERGPGRCKLSTGHDLQSQHPVATVAGHPFTVKNSTASVVAPAAVKKEKPRNMTAVTQAQQPDSVCVSSPRFLQHPEKPHLFSNGGLSQSFCEKIQNQHLSSRITLSNQQRILNDNAPHATIQSDHQGEFENYISEDPHFSRNIICSDMEAQERINDTFSALINPLHQTNEITVPVQHLGQGHVLLQSGATQNLAAGIGESSQCEMAEADQASMCNSPEKRKAQNDVLSSADDSIDTIHEVILKMPLANSVLFNSGQTLNDFKADEDGKKENVTTTFTNIDGGSSEVVHCPTPESDGGQPNLLVLNTLNSSMFHEDLTIRRMQEESANGLTVNAIVEEILNSPINSGRNTPTSSDIEIRGTLST